MYSSLYIPCKCPRTSSYFPNRLTTPNFISLIIIPKELAKLNPLALFSNEKTILFYFNNKSVNWIVSFFSKDDTNLVA